jgi:UDP-N-acetylmuramate: L-alanyl-gamma-D-glutamyl-meso-diaminopimelate ligase
VVLTSVEFDHADIYTDLDHVKAAFRRLMALVPADGLVIVRDDDDGAAEVASEAGAEVWRYGPGRSWDGRIEAVDTATGTMTFSILRDGAAIAPPFTTIMVGEHNLYNQVAAAAAAIRAGVSPERLDFGSFLGIKRRQEVIGEPGGVTVIDDFAHHPTAVRVTLAALRQRFGKRRLWAVWEPRSATSRRNVFQADYASAFDDADQVVIARPFDTSRIPEAERFSADLLVEDLGRRGVDAVTLPDAETIAATVATRAHPHDVVAVLSNGGFDGLHGRLLHLLGERFAERAAPHA